MISRGIGLLWEPIDLDPVSHCTASWDRVCPKLRGTCVAADLALDSSCFSVVPCAINQQSSLCAAERLWVAPGPRAQMYC